MAIAPFAKKKLIPKWNKTKITRHRRMNLHVAVAEASSLFTMFSNSSSACSHFYVAKDGTIEQYIDTAYRSAADMNGNDSTISVETQGGVKNPEGEPWTAAQVKSLIKLWAWARDVHGIKNQVAKNTQTNENSAGLSWHRLGVEGNFASRKGILSTSWKPGGIKYSSARGKICPGDAKIMQIPEIWAAANKSNNVTPTTPAKPKPKPVDKPVDKTPKPVDKPSAAIKKVQTILKSMGLYKGLTDGINGSMTKASVKAYQAGQKYGNLYADGNWGSITQNHYAFTLKLQKALNAWKGTKLLVDGYYGASTAARVREWQLRNRGGSYRGVVDGIPGSMTKKALGI